MQNKKITSAKIVFAVLLLFLILFSIGFEVIETNHECCGHDCPICNIILIIQQNINFFSILVILHRVFNLFTAKTTITTLLTVSAAYTINSLFLQKIRFND